MDTHGAVFKSHVCQWWRYIDDVFVIWRGSREEAHDFVKSLNCNELNLKFTADISDTKVEFLDVEIYIEENTIQTKLHRKNTAGNSVLHAQSAHPRHLIKSIPYGEFLRARRICSTAEELDKCHKESFLRFKARGYTEKDLKVAISKVMLIPRDRCLGISTRVKDSSPVGNPETTPITIRMITTFCKQERMVRKILYKNWPIIMTDLTMSQLVPDLPLLTFRKAPSMRDELVKSSPETSNTSMWLSVKEGFFKCNTCRACKFGRNQFEYTTPFDDIPIKIKGHHTCRTDHAVYILKCSCDLIYVESTKLQVYARILQHLRAIVNSDSNYPVARHFKAVHSNDLKDLYYFVIDAVPKQIRGGNRERQLRQLESRYIVKLDSKMPNGLNTGDDLHNFL